MEVPDENVILESASWDYPSLEVGGSTGSVSRESGSDHPHDNSHDVVQLIHQSFSAGVDSAFDQAPPSESRRGEHGQLPSSIVHPPKTTETPYDDNRLAVASLQSVVLELQAKVDELSNSMRRMQSADEQRALDIQTAVLNASERSAGSTENMIACAIKEATHDLRTNNDRGLSELKSQLSAFESVPNALQNLISEALNAKFDDQGTTKPPDVEAERFRERLLDETRETRERLRQLELNNAESSQKISGLVAELKSEIGGLQSHMSVAADAGKSVGQSGEEVTETMRKGMLRMEERVEAVLAKRISPLTAQLEGLANQMNQSQHEKSPEEISRPTSDDESRDVKRQLEKLNEMILSQNNMLKELSSKIDNNALQNPKGGNAVARPDSESGGRVLDQPQNDRDRDNQPPPPGRRPQGHPRGIPATADNNTMEGDVRGSFVKPPMPSYGSSPPGGYRPSGDYQQWSTSTGPVRGYGNEQAVGQPTGDHHSRYGRAYEEQQRREEEEANRQAQRRRREQERLAREAEEARRRKQEEERLAEEKRKKAELDAKTRNLMSSLITHDAPLGKPSLFGEDGGPSRKTGGLFDD